ncbi:hypothetical protein EVG20_g6671 [Dentipellis fragilis]|uniref:DUF6697 domain-containing protein n=1 Tax=Dentipellis fragilis TaxID=205917 RepID=A0A4Y9YJH3_9AGAM|nr:hypothetical protein EVG20_g6671 [Dentipellis fragilis]
MSTEDIQEILDPSLEENLRLQAIIKQLHVRVKQLEDEVAHLRGAKVVLFHVLRCLCMSHCLGNLQHESLRASEDGNDVDTESMLHQASIAKKRSASPFLDAGPSTSVAPDADIDSTRPRSSKKPRMKAEVVIERPSSRAGQKAKQRTSIIPKVELKEDPKVPIEPEEVRSEQVAIDGLADIEEIPRAGDNDGDRGEEIPRAKDGNDRSDEAWASATAALSVRNTHLLCLALHLTSKTSYPADVKIDVKKGLELDAATVQTRIDAIGRDPFPVTLEPAIRNVWVSRDYMRVAYGGNMQETFPNIGEEMLKKHGLNDFFYLNLSYHPNGPKEPGFPGLWFDSAPSNREDDRPARTFVRLRSSKWLYVGQYIFRNSPPLSQEEWLLQSTQVQNTWARQILRQGWGWKVRARITYRRDHMREPTQQELRDAMEAEQAFKDITARGHTCCHLGITAIKCVGYDEEFQRKIAAEFSTWEPPPKKTTGGRKGSKANGKGRGRVAKQQKEGDEDGNEEHGANKKKGKGRAAKRRADADSGEDDDGDGDNDEPNVWELGDDEDDDDVLVLPSTSKGTRSRPRSFPKTRASLTSLRSRRVSHMQDTQAVAHVTIGILALQGAFAEHQAMLQKLSSKTKVMVTQVRTAEELAACDALVIPGGGESIPAPVYLIMCCVLIIPTIRAESTTIALLAKLSGLLEPLREFVRTHPVWGTCAGAILLAQAIANPKQGGQELLGGVSVTIARNGWGSQVESFEAQLEVEGMRNPEVPFTGVFIRAPVILSVLPAPEGQSIRPIARLPAGLLPPALAGENAEHDQTIVGLRQGHHLLTTFHPELTHDNRFHEYFVRECVVPFVAAQA